MADNLLRSGAASEHLPRWGVRQLSEKIHQPVIQALDVVVPLYVRAAGRRHSHPIFRGAA